MRFHRIFEIARKLLQAAHLRQARRDSQSTRFTRAIFRDPQQFNVGVVRDGSDNCGNSNVAKPVFVLGKKRE
jgi:hypothetical protein